jgi:hypothetical protein
MCAISPGFRSRLAAYLTLIALAAPAASADDKPAPRPANRAAAGTLVSETASLLRREAPDKPWQVVKEKEELFTGDELLGGIRGTVEARGGAVRLEVAGDMDATSPFPVLETVFVLHEAKGVDLDLTLDRGRLRLVNAKEQGAARVRLRVGDWAGEVVLTGPAAAVALEIHSRWPGGVPFRKDPRPGEAPVVTWFVLALKGEVVLKDPRHEFTLKAPPGPALLEGDTLDEAEPSPQFFGKLPAWAAGAADTEKAKELSAVMARWRKRAAETSPNEAADELLKSDDEAARRSAVVLLAALDDMDRLGEALVNARHQDVWDAGILALRQWIGRGRGQDQKLYQLLTRKKTIPPREAEAILQLLHGFGDDDLEQPETYEALISYLGSERLSLRELAYWHLRRLVPAGRTIDYDPLAPKERREAGIKPWRQLVPAGKLPPKPGGK